MLVKLTPEQVAEYWRILRPAIRQTAPPQIAVSNEATKNILKNLIAGKGTVWLYAEPDISRVYGMTVTAPQMDPLVEDTALVVWGVYSFGDVTQDMMEDAIARLMKYAAENNYSGLLAYSDNEELSRFLETKGANTDFNLIRFSLS